MIRPPRVLLPILAITLSTALAQGSPDGATDDVSLEDEIARLRSELEAIRRDAAAAAEREADAAERVEALERRLADEEAEGKRLRREAAQGSTRRPLPRPEPADGGVRGIPGRVFVVTTDSNLRAGPALSQPVLTVLAMGTEVTAYGEVGDWVRVRLADGRGGWIFRGLLVETRASP